MTGEAEEEDERESRRETGGERVTRTGRDVARRLKAENGEKGDRGGKARGEERERGTRGEGESDGKKRNGDKESESGRSQARVDYFFCYLMWISFVIARIEEEIKAGKKRKKWEGKGGGKGGRPGVVASEQAGLLDQTTTAEQRTEE
jgi:hypothetical protein